MPAKLIDGKKIADMYLTEVRDYIKTHGIMPKIVTILVGDDPASHTYVDIKQKTCQKIGIDVEIHRPVQDKDSILQLIQKLNNDSSVNGILVQLPLPPGINEEDIISRIDESKDVDGLHPMNIGRLAYGDESMPACTAFGIIKILENENIELEGSNVVILGRGIHVGKPLYSMLVNRNATVTLCHSKTRNLSAITKNADIIIVAIGKSGYLTGDMIKEGSVLIDVGINKVNGELKGDIDFDSVKNKASLITPVPGGVGPMTVAMLAKNTLSAYIRQHSND
ncbi:MAG: bifunctional 5,10-methylenetetrahydrofolate dehydrogenase/5,10-methenyltetrahydrofolate cyclohydrolase [Candidatus Aenigmatarchaeota archaeon]